MYLKAKAVVQGETAPTDLAACFRNGAYVPDSRELRRDPGPYDVPCKGHEQPPPRVGAYATTGLLMAVLGLVGCGSTPGVGPSPVTVPSPGPVTVVGPPALPTDVDPGYLRALVPFDVDGYPRQWEGEGFSHCGAVDEALADELSRISGRPRREGPCNVEWVRLSGAGHPTTVLHGTARVIVYAHVTLYDDGDVRIARHELGHVLGLNHSPRREDLMAPTPEAQGFSPDELRVLRWLYRPSAK